MAGVVDADTHIAESEAMWSYINKEIYPRIPILVKIPDDTCYQERNAPNILDFAVQLRAVGRGGDVEKNRREAR